MIITYPSKQDVDVIIHSSDIRVASHAYSPFLNKATCHGHWPWTAPYGPCGKLRAKFLATLAE